MPPSRAATRSQYPSVPHSVPGLGHGGSAPHGRVSCWGDNERGATGDGTRSGTVPIPQHVAGVTEAVDLCVGGASDNFACALRSGGEVLCWGSNGHGGVGNGEPLPGGAVLTPTPVVGLSDARDIECGSLTVCALRDTGEVSCCRRRGRGGVLE